MMPTSRTAGATLLPLLLLGSVVACSSDELSPNPAGGAAGAAASGAAGTMTNGGVAGAAPSGGAAGAGAGAAGASMGGSAGGSGGGTAVGLPASDSKDDLLAFLKAETYRSAPWIAESEAPRAPMGSPHGRVQVWMNPPLVDSWRNGRDSLMGNPRADVSSLAVKELYDDGGARVGHAVIYRSGAADQPNSWVFYCYGPSGRCDNVGSTATEAMPVYGRGVTSNSCYFCHSTIIQGLQPFLTKPPPP